MVLSGADTAAIANTAVGQLLFMKFLDAHPDVKDIEKKLLVLKYHETL